MKLIFIACPSTPSQPPVFFIKPDTALLRNNQPFFIPDYTHDLRATLSLVVRISRLGRSIGAPFAVRYFDAIGAGMDIFAHDLWQQCTLAGQPADCARSFDCAAPVSPDFVPVSEIPDIKKCSLHWSINGKEFFQDAAIPYSPEDIIPHISQFITLRTGDYIFINTPLSSGALHAGDRLRAFLNGNEMLDVKIK
ncbi:MAG: fumarylacetoacetate hydrolase family protein [Prevotellaceae bacterium]|jgi:2-keto-4-pentenoate hydratase/2-oxohepta-3-ene-1,7-dioic acid hydratase in catechol pathway|nr:fumarylacetoacetate hydrolase family protein [Prevotellaceae bacterium]